MCGIAGIFSIGETKAVIESEIVRMRDTMTPRGPDDAGIYLYEEKALSLGFGHRRLSIIDLSNKGHQPSAVLIG